jgi:putative ABC transport system substrate-binding protein
MRRRDLISLLAGAAAAWPIAAHSQQQIGQKKKMPRLGILMTGPSGPSATILEPFYLGLHELGYDEGRNIVIVRRYGDSVVEQLPALAAELVKLNVDIIVAWSTPAALAAQRATKTIPIVAAVMADPVGDELVANLARPGGNITGTTFLGPELVSKRLQLLKEIIPGLSRVAALWQPHAYGARTMANMSKEMEASARTLGMQLQFVPAAGPAELASAFSTIIKERPDAFILMPSPILFGQYRRIVTFAANNRLPAMYQAREIVEGGGLMSYGANLGDLFRSAAPFVHKILNGANPSELPVEQPTKFELVINLKTAKELGLTITREVQLIADEVIE